MVSVLQCSWLTVLFLLHNKKLCHFSCDFGGRAGIGQYMMSISQQHPCLPGSVDQQVPPATH